VTALLELLVKASQDSQRFTFVGRGGQGLALLSL